MGHNKKINREEIISRIVELETMITEAVSKGHKSHTHDEFQPYRDELKTLRKHSELPDDALVLTQRVEDKYYEENGWGVVLKESTWYETEQEQYHPAWCCVKYNDDENLYIDLHY